MPGKRPGISFERRKSGTHLKLVPDPYVTVLGDNLAFGPGFAQQPHELYDLVEVEILGAENHLADTVHFGLFYQGTGGISGGKPVDPIPGHAFLVQNMAYPKELFFGTYDQVVAAETGGKRETLPEKRKKKWSPERGSKLYRKNLQ